MRLIHDSRATTSFVEESIAAWHQSSTQFPSLGRHYSEDEQQQRERLFDLAIKAAQAELQTLPRTRSERTETYGRLTSLAARLARFVLDLDDPYFESSLRDDFSKVGNDLALSARSFDASVSL